MKKMIMKNLMIKQNKNLQFRKAINFIFLEFSSFSRNISSARVSFFKNLFILLTYYYIKYYRLRTQPI